MPTDPLARDPADDPFARADAAGIEVFGAGGAGDPTQHSLVELINHVLDRGVVVTGDVTISVAGVDLVYLGLNAVLTSVSTARDVLGRRVGDPNR